MTSAVLRVHARRMLICRNWVPGVMTEISRWDGKMNYQ